MERGSVQGSTGVGAVSDRLVEEAIRQRVLAFRDPQQAIDLVDWANVQL